MVLSPSSACFILKTPDPRPVPLELLRLGCSLGKGGHPQHQGPSFSDPLLLLLLLPALSSPWAGGRRPQTPMEEGASADERR